MLDFDDIDDEDLTTSLEEEIEILDEAYRNAYKVATGKMTVQQLLDEAGDMVFLPFVGSAQRPTVLFSAGRGLSSAP